MITKKDFYQAVSYIIFAIILVGTGEPLPIVCTLLVGIGYGVAWFLADYKAEKEKRGS